MSNQQSAKGNPASKRMGNPNRARRYTRNWEAQQKRKAVRIKEEKVREKENREAAGYPTPWEFAKQVRSMRRRPKQDAWEARHDVL